MYIYVPSIRRISSHKGGGCITQLPKGSKSRWNKKRLRGGGGLYYTFAWWLCAAAVFTLPSELLNRWGNVTPFHFRFIGINIRVVGHSRKRRRRKTKTKRCALWPLCTQHVKDDFRKRFCRRWTCFCLRIVYKFRWLVKRMRRMTFWISPSFAPWSIFSHWFCLFTNMNDSFVWSLSRCIVPVCAYLQTLQYTSTILYTYLRVHTYRSQSSKNTVYTVEGGVGVYSNFITRYRFECQISCFESNANTSGKNDVELSRKKYTRKCFFPRLFVCKRIFSRLWYGRCLRKEVSRKRSLNVICSTAYSSNLFFNAYVSTL